MLHPRLSLWGYIRSSLYYPKVDLSQLSPCSMTSVDLAAICPCIAITPHDKLQIIEECLAIREIPHSGQKGYVFNKNIYRLATDPPQVGLRHDCSFSKLSATVSIRTRLFLEGEPPSLQVLNWYTFKIPSEGVPGKKTLLSRPQEDAGR